MKKISILPVIFLFAFASFVLAEKTMRVPFQAPPSGVQFVPDEFVVKFKSGVGKVSPSMVNGVAQIGVPAFDALNRTFKVDKMKAQFPGARAQAGLPDLSGYHVLRFSGRHKLQEVLGAYSRLPSVHHVERIGIHPIYGTPDDPYFDDPPPTFPYYQWHFEQGSADHDVDAAAAWDIETGDEEIIIAIIDSGVRYIHKDLGGYLAPSDVTQGNIWINWAEYNGRNKRDDDGNGYKDDWVGWDFVNGATPCWPGEDCAKEDNDPSDFNGHGTHVAGIVGAITNNTYCGAGLAGGWNSERNAPANGIKIMCLRAGWSGPYGGYEVGWVRMDFCAEAMYYAADNGASVVNCSWGSSASGGLPAAVDYAISQGLLIIAGAGNDGDDIPDYLGTRTDVMNVAATDSFDVKADFSDYGTWVDVSAPGVDVLSTAHNHADPDNDYIALISGTSQACPHAVGAAALVKSRNPGLTRQQIWDLIVNYADDIDALNPGYEGLLGSGRVNAYTTLLNTPLPPPDTLHVISIVVDRERKGQNYNGIAWVTIENQYGTPVPGALVVGDWSGPTSDHDEETTDGSGVATIKSDKLRDPVGSWCFTVTSVTKSGDIDAPEPPVTGCESNPYPKSFTTSIPSTFTLSQNYPNPFNPVTHFSVNLKAHTHVNFVIYNVAGQKVRTLVDEVISAGSQTIIWDGTNDRGDALSSGVYFYRVAVGSEVMTKKMTLLK
jgi:subtilisin family serine protease